MYDADRVIERLREGNERFIRGDRADHDFPHRRLELLDGQRPMAAVVSCSDSRVVPEYVFDANLGDLFTIVTAGNVLDDVGTGSLEYAVEHLHVPLILLLGHTRCGAVTACCRSRDEAAGFLERVMRRIDPAVDRAHGDVETAVEENLWEVRRGLLEASAVVREQVQAGRLRVEMAVYLLETGGVRWIEAGAPRTA
jgi:carbonic anhydrase